MKRPTRYLHKEIKSGAHRLGKKVEFLDEATYLALTQHKTKGKLVWYAEVALREFQELLEEEKRSLKRKQQIVMLQRKLSQALEESDELRSQIQKVEATNEDLMRNNQTLMSNIEDDKRPDGYFRSSKSPMNRLQERAIAGVNPMPLQGGLAGLEKK